MSITVSNIERVSTDSAGNQGDSISFSFANPAFSPDGTKVVFESYASNLVPGDTNGIRDVFVKDLVTGFTTAIYSDSAGNLANKESSGNIFSPDSTKVLFESEADNLVSGDTNGTFDVFVKDLVSGSTIAVNSDSAGNIGNQGSFGDDFSPDGTKVLFTSLASNLVAGDTNNATDVFVKDLVSGAVTRVSTDSVGNQGDGYSTAGTFSPDGTKVLFESEADNLVSGDTNNARDLFIKDLSTGDITRVSTGSAGNQGDGGSDLENETIFSPDGTKVLFRSYADNLVAGDTNGEPDFFVKDLVSGSVTLVNADSAGNQGNGLAYIFNFSPDSTKVLFRSFSNNLVSGDSNIYADNFVKDLVTGATIAVNSDSVGNYGNNGSYNAIFSPDGTKILFESYADNLVAGDTNGSSDVFVKDLASGTVTRVSTDSAGNQGNSNSSGNAFSPDGTKVLFGSYADNLVAGDTNGQREDVFVKDLVTGETSIISTDSAGNQGNGFFIFNPVFSPDGTQVLFSAGADNLVPDDTNGSVDVFLVTLTDASIITGTVGADTLRGGDGNDTISGLGGNDRLLGLGGNDSIDGGIGNDTLRGGDGDDSLLGGSGNDTIYGDGGDDYINGGNSADSIRGGDGNDTLYGGSAADLLRGDAGNDIAFGESGADDLRMGAGDDTLNGGTGQDKLYGEAGADTFVFDLDAFNAVDRIKDFSAADGDTIRLDGILSGFDPLTSAITDYARFATGLAGSYLSVDRDGAGASYGFERIAVVEDVPGLDAQTLYDTGVLLVA